jgi:coenzyme F420-reducing hydrogenase alpha subunit
MSDRRIFVDYIARVEGDGAIDIVIGPNGELKKARWEVWEPPRFFEGFLVGRSFEEVPEMVQRICGICPHPHLLASMISIERAMGVQVSEQTVLLRKLLALGDWFMSHVLHVYFLAMPDFLGYESVVAMAGNEALLPIVGQALKYKRLGNDISVLITGNEIQNRTAVVGGFTAVPTMTDLRKLNERLKEAKDFAYETVKLGAKLASQPPYSDLVRECEHVALRSNDHYAIIDGNLISNRGLDVPNWEYPEVILERHVPGNNAKQAIIKGRDSFLTGPLARVNLNFDLLSADAQAAAKDIGFTVPNYNPFMSLVARGIELIHTIDDFIATVDQLGQTKYEKPSYQVKAGEAYAVTEAPRGICCHGGRIGKDGIVQKYDIVAPTARNTYNLEKDFEAFIPKLVDRSDEELKLLAEMMIRNYDPCQSCATHLMRVKIHREA